MLQGGLNGTNLFPGSMGGRRVRIRNNLTVLIIGGSGLGRLGRPGYRLRFLCSRYCLLRLRGGATAVCAETNSFRNRVITIGTIHIFFLSVRKSERLVKIRFPSIPIISDGKSPCPYSQYRFRLINEAGKSIIQPDENENF